MLQTNETLAYSIKGASKACNLGQTKLYEEIKLGRLKAVKYGRRTLIPAEALKDWLNNLPLMNEDV